MKGIVMMAFGFGMLILGIWMGFLGAKPAAEKKASEETIPKWQWEVAQREIGHRTRQYLKLTEALQSECRERLFSPSFSHTAAVLVIDKSKFGPLEEMCFRLYVSVGWVASPE